MLPNRVRRAVKENYVLSRVYADLRYHLAPVYKSNPLIIYQMGKVGSESVERSLAACRLNRPIYRAHSLVEAHIDQSLADNGLSSREYYRRSPLAFHGKSLAREIARDLYRGHWQVITMVRDPIAQNVSTFFQILDMVIPDFHQRLANGTIETDELMQVFLERYPPDSVFITWFDVEMKPSFHIDVFASEFDTSAGYQIYREPHVELLLMRLEDLDRCAPAAFEDFLGLKDFRIVRTNEASRKPYSDLYRRFCEEAVFPASYVDQIYGSKYARTFYTPAEIEGFRSRLNVGP